MENKSRPGIECRMLRAFLKVLAGVVLMAHLGGWACYWYDDDDDWHDEEDVRVEITGNTGTDFDAFFEDDDDSDSFSADVPYTAVFNDREDFFTAIVDKDSGGSEEICVRVTTDHDSHQDCTDQPFGRVSVTVVF